MDFELHRRAQRCIAQNYLTNSKRPESLVKGVYPTHVKAGIGAYLIGHDGQRYLDFITGLGTNLLGYGNDRVAQAIERVLRSGYSHSLATHHELDCAEKIKELFPFVDCVKFTKTGSAACSAAIRIARAATGRMRVLSEGYHGTDDAFVSLTPPALGVPVGALAVEKYSPTSDLSDVAAVIIEPVITVMDEERINSLKTLREACTRAGCLLIFDEIITGLRFPRHSVSGHLGITPDLICLGKALANGLPLAVVGGKYAVMNCGEYFISSTYAGETLSLVAATQVMTMLQTNAYDVEQLWAHGQRFVSEFNLLWPGKLWLEAYPARGVFRGDEMTRALFFQEACKAGLLFGPSWWFNFPMIAEYQNALGAIRAIVTRIKNGEVALEGQMPQSPFAQRVREAS